MRRADIVAGSVLVLLAAYVMYEASRLPAKITGSGLGPGIVPFYLAGMLAILALFMILKNLLSKADGSEEFEISRAEITGLEVVFIAQAIYIFSIKYLGFGTATICFVTFLSNLLGKYPWWKCCAFGLIVALLTVYLFKGLLGLPLLPGFTGF